MHALGRTKEGEAKLAAAACGCSHAPALPRQRHGGHDERSRRRGSDCRARSRALELTLGSSALLDTASPLASDSSPQSVGAPAALAVKAEYTTPSEVDRWRKTFDRFATRDSIGGVSYLTEPDFVSAVAPESDFAKISRQQYGILFNVADRRRSGRVVWEDFVAFQELLKSPAADYDVSLRMTLQRDSSHFGCFC